jgi:hypothetical protein
MTRSPSVKKRQHCHFWEFTFKHAHRKDTDVVAMLLTHGAIPTWENASGQTAFYTFVFGLFENCSSEQAFKLVKLFIEKGGSIDYDMHKKLESSFLVKNNEEFKQFVKNHTTSCMIQ